MITIAFICTAFSTAQIQTQSIPTETDEARGIQWSATLTLTNPGGQNDYAKFGEGPDATDGSPADAYDTVKPPLPMTPFIRTWFNDNIPDPYDELWEDYRHYPATNKVWNLTVQWVPSDYASPTTITIAWNPTLVDASEYTTVNFCTSTGTPLKNMLVDSSYTFTCPALALQYFKVICTVINQPPIANPDSYSTNEDTILTVPAPGVLTNDNDPESNPMTAMKVTDPGHGLVTLNSNGGFMYTPTGNYYGADSFIYKAFDGTSYSSNATVTITVNPINDAPIVTDIPGQTIAEGSTFATINLDNYVSDVDNTDAQMTWTYSGNTQLTVSIVSRVATITVPNSDWNGAETITFRATDPGALWDDDAATFTVTAVNDPPVVSGIPDQTIIEGSTFTTIILDNFVTDVDNTDAQMAWTYSGNSQLTVSIVSRIATITIPNADWYGSETITFRATDPGGLWDDDAAIFTVTNINDPPIVTNIPDQTIAEGSTFATISLDTYVSDVDNTDAQMTWTYSGNTQLTVSIVARVATITVPNSDWFGSETITFKATDPSGLWDDDAAIFTITNINDAPIVIDIPGQTIVEGSTFATITLDNYVSDVDNLDSEMIWTYSGNVELTVSIVDRVATIIIPNEDWYGSETITFRATDPSGLWDDDSATFTVTNVNYPPIVTDIPSQTITEGSTFATITLDNYVSDPDNLDSEMTWTFSGNTQLTVSIVARVATITVPNSDWFGSETITFKATDPSGLWDDDAATFTVTNINDPPIVTNIPDQTIAEGSTFVTISLDNYVSDVDNTDAQMSWTYSGNTQLTVSIVSRVATITVPNSDWNGAETITFRATDPSGLWDDDPATFTVTAVNDPPVVSGIPDQTIIESSTFTTIILDNFVTDVDNTDAQMTWTYSGNSQLTVSIVSRIATITIPNADWYGSETITFRATDPGGLWDDDAAVFTVTNVNDAPIVTDIPDQTIAEGSTFATISLDTYVSDVDNTDAQMSWTYSGNSELTVSIVSRIATITVPNSDWFGSETITFKATDPGGLWDDDPATFTVTSVNDAPVVTDIPDQTVAEGSLFSTISLDDYVSDVDNLDSEMTWTYSGNVELTVSIVDRVATIIIPNEDWYGSETISFKATDPGSLWDDDAALFTVTPVQDNLPPNEPNRPSGPVSGKINDESSFTTNTTDPNNDQVYYMWDWGDGTQSNWFGPYNSGQSAQANHSWGEKGSYDIKVKAKDTNNSESNWSEPYTVYILQKAFIFGMIRNADPSDDLTTFEPIRVRILWLSPFSISLQKTGLIIVTKNPFHGFIGGSIIFGRFYAAPLTNATINPESSPIQPDNSIQAEKTVKSPDYPLTSPSSPLI